MSGNDRLLLKRAELLLERAARCYEKHEAGRQDPFNVFSVLRSESDEVNLHSRFLAALLDYRKSPDKPRRNLEDFLRSFVYDDKRSIVGGDTPRFEPDRMIVERESDNIDILICDPDSKLAVVIENKIHAGDSPGQLQRYPEHLRGRGYRHIHVLYLTPDGSEASEDSAGGVDYTPVSYRDLISWLERCQEHAYDVPALRESVAQYLHLVRKMTGTDFTEAYMNDLKKLCLKGNNLVLIHELSKAMIEVRISLLVKLWKEIECELRNKIQNLSDQRKDSNICEERIRKFVTHQTHYNLHGLYYAFSDSAALCVEIENWIFFGVKCSKKNEDEYNNIKKKMRKLKGGEPPEEDWPWWKWAPGDVNLKRPTRDNLELLADDRKRQRYAADIATGASEVWQRLQKAGLA